MVPEEDGAKSESWSESQTATAVLEDVQTQEVSVAEEGKDSESHSV